MDFLPPGRIERPCRKLPLKTLTIFLEVEYQLPRSRTESAGYKSAPVVARRAPTLVRDVPPPFSRLFQTLQTRDASSQLADFVKPSIPGHGHPPPGEKTIFPHWFPAATLTSATFFSPRSSFRLSPPTYRDLFPNSISRSKRLTFPPHDIPFPDLLLVSRLPVKLLPSAQRMSFRVGLFGFPKRFPRIF